MYIAQKLTAILLIIRMFTQYNVVMYVKMYILK